MKNIKRVLLTLCMITCFAALTACGSTEVKEKKLDEGMAQQICQYSEMLLQQVTSVGKEDIPEQIEMAENDDMQAYAAALTTWSNLIGDTGKLEEIKDSTAGRDDDGYNCRINAQFEKRMVEFTVYFDKEGMLSSTSFVADYTTGETLTKAGLNTLMGMGTVFTVLIFISLLIACFKFIHEFENKVKSGTTSAAPAPAPAPAAAVTESAEEELADDFELVAVITAAIAASTGASADSLVVRSIKRAGVSKWKRA